MEDVSGEELGARAGDTAVSILEHGCLVLLLGFDDVEGSVGPEFTSRVGDGIAWNVPLLGENCMSIDGSLGGALHSESLSRATI